MEEMVEAEEEELILITTVIDLKVLIKYILISHI